MKEFVISEVKAETAVLVGLITQEQDEAKTKEYLDELEFLADTAGAVTVKRFTQKVQGPSQVTYVGKGKLEEIKQYIKQQEDAADDDPTGETQPVGMVIFDDELSAKQIRNIEAEPESEDSRPHLPDSRHLRHAGTDCRGEDTGGTGTVPLYAAPSATPVDPPGTTRWRFRLWWRKG